MTPTRTKFFVAGVPAPGGSKKAFIVNGRAHVTDDCKRNAPWRNSVSMFAASAHQGDPFSGPICLDVEFVMPRIKAHFKTGKHAGMLKPGAPSRHTVKPDATKLLRALEDALTGICWRDDAQVCVQRVTKRYGDRVGARVEVTCLGDSDDIRGAA